MSAYEIGIELNVLAQNITGSLSEDGAKALRSELGRLSGLLIEQKNSEIPADMMETLIDCVVYAMNDFPINEIKDSQKALDWLKARKGE